MSRFFTGRLELGCIEQYCFELFTWIGVNCTSLHYTVLNLLLFSIYPSATQWFWANSDWPLYLCVKNWLLMLWVTNFLCLSDRLICLSRIDQAKSFAWFAWAELIRLGGGAWFAWAGLIRLGRGAWFAWAGLIRLRGMPDFHEQNFWFCSENQAIRQTT